MKSQEICVSQDLVDKTKLLKAELDELGREINNPNPAFISVGPKPLTITEQIQRLLRVELSRQAQEQGFETFEESDDLEVEDDDDAPLSAYQDERLMKPDWPGPQETTELSKKADLADLDMEAQESPEVSAGVFKPTEAGGIPENPPPRKAKPAPKKG